jgi:hypothetical protein
MRDTPTLPDVLEQLGRLANALGKPFDVDEEDAGMGYMLAFKWHGVPMSAVVAAVDEAIATMDRWPKPATLAAMARKLTPKTDAERNFGSDEFAGDRCLVCKGRWFHAGYQGSMIAGGLLRVRCLCPTPAPGWWTAAALACVETDPRMPKAPDDYATNPQYRGQARLDSTHQLRLA